jgi:hypothetical protein
MTTDVELEFDEAIKKCYSRVVLDFVSYLNRHTVDPLDQLEYRDQCAYRRRLAVEYLEKCGLPVPEHERVKP